MLLDLALTLASPVLSIRPLQHGLPSVPKTLPTLVLCVQCRTAQAILSDLRKERLEGCSISHAKRRV